VCRVDDRGADNVISLWQTPSQQESTITVEGNGNSIEFDPYALVEGCTIVVKGDGNQITVGSGRSTGLGIALTGNHNAVILGAQCTFFGLGAVCEDSGNRIEVREGTEFAGPTELAALEGTTIRVGSGCLFSGGIHVRTGDSHSLVDLNGHRINPSRDIHVGDHVWLGRNVTLLKGSRVPDSSVVGTCAVVTKAFEIPHCVIAGNPARVVRENVDWRTERISCE